MPRSSWACREGDCERLSGDYGHGHEDVAMPPEASTDRMPVLVSQPMGVWKPNTAVEFAPGQLPWGAAAIAMRATWGCVKWACGDGVATG